MGPKVGSKVGPNGPKRVQNGLKEAKIGLNSPKSSNESKKVQIGPHGSKWVKIAQCGNLMIFLSPRFYVKSILDNIEVLKLPILPFFEALNFANLVHFSIQKVKKKS